MQKQVVLPLLKGKRLVSPSWNENDLEKYRLAVQADQRAETENFPKTKISGRSGYKIKKYINTLAAVKIGQQKTDLKNEKWVDTISIRSAKSKKRKIGLTAPEKVMKTAQKKELNSVVNRFDVMSAEQIVREAFRYLDSKEVARTKCTSVKGPLNRTIKMAPHVGKAYVQELVARTNLKGDVEYNKGRCLSLQREVEALKAQVENLKMNGNRCMTVQADVHDIQTPNRTDKTGHPKGKAFKVIRGRKIIINSEVEENSATYSINKVKETGDKDLWKVDQTKSIELYCQVGDP